MQLTSLVVGTDGSPELDSRVRQAAQAAAQRGVPLHVICRVTRLAPPDQRRLDSELPADLRHLAGAAGQRDAAVREVRAMLVSSGVDLHVTASDRRLGAAVRAAAAQIDGEVFGARRPRAKRLPILRLRPRTAI